MEGKDLALARRLVDVDAKARGRALKKFRQWLNARAAVSALQGPSNPGEEGGNGVMTNLDMLKIMKAIYFCMWHADKPLLQEELAKNLASLIHVFKRLEDTMLFINAFFNTIQQQWSNIDKLRLDKFYLLMREFLKQCFKYLSNHEWSEVAIKSFTGTLESHPLELISEHISDGVKLHLIDIYLDELLIAYRNIPMSTLITMIEPFKPLATKSPNKIIRQSTIANIFDRVCTLIEKGKGVNLFAEKALYEEFISKMAANKGTLESCRNKLYTVKHKLLVMTQPEAALEYMEVPLPESPPEVTPPIVTETAELAPDLLQEANGVSPIEESDVIVEKTSNNIEDIDLDGDETNHEDGDFANELNALVEGDTVCEEAIDDDATFDFSNDVFSQPANGEAEDQELLEMASFFVHNKTGKKRKRKSKAKKNSGKGLHIVINPPLHDGFQKWRSLDDVNNALGAWYNEDELSLSPSTPSPSYEIMPSKKKRVTFSGEKPYIREFRKGSAAIMSPEVIAFEKSLTPTKGILKPLKDLSP